MSADLATSPTPYQLLPRLTDEEYQALKADIAENGIRVPIDVDENGVVLDGHHRAWIAADLHVDCPRRVVTGLTDEQKRAHAIAANVYRRSLTREQRREMVGRLRSLGMSIRQIAEVASVSHETVRQDAAVPPVNNLTRHTEPVRVTGSDGKVYQPQTLDQRRDLAAKLRDQGLSIAEIGEAMGVAKSTAQSLLAPRKSVSSPAPSKSPADTPRKIERIRQLASEGYASAQIGRDLGVGEQQVRKLARDNEIAIPADRVMSKQRRIDSNTVVAEIVATVEQLGLPMRLVNFSELDMARADEWANSLTESIRALNRFTKQIKELAQ